MPAGGRGPRSTPNSGSCRFARAARDRGALSAAGLAAVEGAMERLRDDVGAWTAERPSRLHGDLWSGNVLWGPDGTAWVIDPAAQGGHRETDLAMLALFGAPHLDRIVAAYDEHRPLADGWRQRVGLHQLHPLLVHAVLFGAGYGNQAAAVAGRAGNRPPAVP
ncbi:MAG TPA: fructosamine kinase family protein [Acidimicrobiales bacterium]|nr:fructosamine kinase family protein [Acidimicrobiales bacterium]